MNNLNRQYVPKKRKKTNYFLVVSFLVLLLVLSVVTVKYLNRQSNEKIDQFSICPSYDAKQSRSLLREQTYHQTRSLAEIGFYGEVLGLYAQKYEPNGIDWMNGKTVFVKNLCNNYPEQAFILNKDLDLKFPLVDLEPGFYTVEVLDGLQRQRLIGAQPLNESMTTVTRDGKRKLVEVFANKEMINDADDVVDEDHLLYIKVGYVEAVDEILDVILDPSALTQHGNGTTNFGGKANGLVESDEMYEIALGVQSILESHGLKVGLSRDSQKPVNYYDSKGRLKQAYHHQAKYFYQLRFVYGWSQFDQGATMIYPSLVSNRLAHQMMKSIQDSSDLVASQWKTGSNRPGVYRSLNKDGREKTDLFREIGGKYTAAGLDDDFQMSEYKDHPFGIHATIVEYGFLTDVKAVSTWNSQKQQIIEATAQGILNGIGV